MVKCQQLVSDLNDLLEIEKFHDYCPNGLQVAGREEIQKVITGVTACQALLDQAIEKKADAILVHHGYFWQGEDDCIIGIKKKRLQTLLQANVNLIAYHLPLDAHLVYGNNVQLAKQLKLEIRGSLSSVGENNIGLLGQLSKPMTVLDFEKHLEAVLGRQPFVISHDRHQVIRKLAWCSGAAQDYIAMAASSEVDAYLTGEVSERTFHLAKELGIHFFAAGHHATERYGVLTLGNYLAQKFNLTVEFVDIYNPV